MNDLPKDCVAFLLRHAANAAAPRPVVEFPWRWAVGDASFIRPLGTVSTHVLGAVTFGHAGYTSAVSVTTGYGR